MTTDTAKLRELLAAATPGEWEVGSDNEQPFPEICKGPYPIIDCTIGECCYENMANATLIVAAVNALPAMLDEIDRIRAALDARGLKIVGGEG